MSVTIKTFRIAYVTKVKWMYTRFSFKKEWSCKKFQNKYVDAYNRYCSGLISQIKDLNLLDVKPVSDSLESCFKAFNDQIGLLCKGTDFCFEENPSYCNSVNDWNDVDEGVRQYKVKLQDEYFRKYNSYCDLYLERISHNDLELNFYIEINAVPEGNEVCVYVSVFLEHFKEENISVPLRLFHKLIPVMEFILKRDYSSFQKEIEELDMEEQRTACIIKMSETVLDVFIKEIFLKYNLKYFFEKDKWGQVVKIRLSETSCLCFRIKPEQFLEQKESLELLVIKALKFVSLPLSGEIMTYGNEAWNN